jgi:hypothetical protein
MNNDNKELKYTLQKMYPILVDSDSNKFKAGDIISNGNTVKVATQSSNFFNFKNWGYTKQELVLATESFINTGQLMVEPHVFEGHPHDFEGCEIKKAKTSYAAGPEALLIFASTGHESHCLPRIGKEFVDLFLNKEGGIKVTNVVIHKTHKDRFQARIGSDGCIITKPVFKKFNKFKKFKK